MRLHCVAMDNTLKENTHDAHDATYDLIVPDFLFRNGTFV